MFVLGCDECSADLAHVSDAAVLAILTSLTATTGADAVLQERQRQIGKGFDAAHDDAHKNYHIELWDAADGYLQGDPAYWPWVQESFHPRGEVWNLARAGALLLSAQQWLERRGEEATLFARARLDVEARLDRLFYESATFLSPDLLAALPGRK